ncbi:hypothetical protein PTTG_11764 [Puccinia triticina 1-1 BBBD Race 1]|uniref:Uncharacterized protein n=1 Tax=Puccinia triticina (isolate 1-1 / race 1 (BBBD)) TaxID=630390 RepID=A0A180GLN0_PUCT1|nr:hypothetical protein PTTG_11764 [Puccinia triticina 1-1 BBBD Race 1]WAR60851.1 hypothetical protein PtB15_13B97 [Puccinia triticina]
MSKEKSDSLLGNGPTPSSTRLRIKLKDPPPGTQINTGAKTAKTPDAVKLIQKVSLEYRFNVPAENEKSSSSPGSNKRKSGTEPEQNFRQFGSNPGKLYILWDLEQQSLSAFKQAAIDAIGRMDGKALAVHAREQDSEGTISWHGSVMDGSSGPEMWTVFDNQDRFLLFLSHCKKASAGLKITVCLVQTDTKLPSQKSKVLKRSSLEDGGPETELSLGGSSEKSQALSPAIMEKIRVIRATHLPCKRLSGSSTLPVFINPKNHKEFVVLSDNMMIHWAKTMITNKEINVYNPPNTLSFNFTNKDDVDTLAKSPDSSPAGTLNSSPVSNANLLPSPVTNVNAQLPPLANTNAHPTPTPNTGGHLAPVTNGNVHPPPVANGNAHRAPMGPPTAYHQQWSWSGMPPTHFYAPHPQQWNMNPAQGPMNFSNAAPGMGHPQMHSHAPSGAQTHRNAVLAPPANHMPPAPAPSYPNLPLDDYLRFVHVPRTSEAFSAALEELGITHYSMFKYFLPSELQEAGIKPAPARALTSNIKNYEFHISCTRPRTQ